MASTIAVPAAANPTLLPAPTVNANPWNFTPNSVIVSAQNNSNFYAVWNYILQLVTYLNQTYVPANGVGAIVAGAGLSAATGAAGEGGKTVTLSNTGLLSLSVGQPFLVTASQTPTLSVDPNGALVTGTLAANGVVYSNYGAVANRLAIGAPLSSATGQATLSPDGAFGITMAFPSSATSGFRIYNANVSLQIFQVTVGGNAYLYGTLTQGSSRKLKRDIAPAPIAVDVVKRLPQLVTYAMRTDDDDVPRQYGFIAEDVPNELQREPEGEGGSLGINLSTLLFMCADTIRQLVARVERLEAA